MPFGDERLEDESPDPAEKSGDGGARLRASKAAAKRSKKKSRGRSSRRRTKTDKEPSSDNKRRPGGGDAVCFTAGFHGASFAAGTTHAYLAADREPPEIVAGISMGALNAAVMQQSYKQLEAADEKDVEAARWKFYRDYLKHLSHDPLRPVWDSLPDLEDFFADRPPVRDPAVPKGMERSAADMTKQRYLQIRTGQGVARSRVTVRAVVKLLVSYVRFKERYGGSWPGLLLRLLWNFLHVIYQLLHQFIRFRALEVSALEPRGISTGGMSIRAWLKASPSRKCRGVWDWVKGLRVLGGPKRTIGGVVLGVLAIVQWLGWAWEGHDWIRWLLVVPGALSLHQVWRPHFGWLVFLPALVLEISVALCALWVAYRALTSEIVQSWLPDYKFFDLVKPFESILTVAAGVSALVLAAAVLVAVVCMTVLWLSPRTRRAILNPVVAYLLARAGLDRSLAKDYRLRIKLRDVFGPNTQIPDEPKIYLPVSRKPKDPPRLLVVVTALQARKMGEKLPNVTGNGKTWLWWRHDKDLVSALRSALATPPILEPTTEKLEAGGEVDLVDGSVVRHNPLPALFDYLRQNEELSRRMVTEGRELSLGKERLHVVYNTPLRRMRPGENGEEESASGDVGKRASMDRTGRDGSSKTPMAEGEASDKKTARTKIREYDGKILYADETTNIVDVLALALRLAHRRDTQIEVKQTRLIGYLERAIWQIHEHKRAHGECSGVQDSSAINFLKNGLMPLFPREIFPDEDPVSERPLAPTTREILNNVAAGCRKTLESQYQEELRRLDRKGAKEVHCADLLSTIAVRRRDDLARRRKEGKSFTPGLPEVCEQCEEMKKKMLRVHENLSRREENHGGINAETCPQLRGQRPRIILVASGGVFRGSFQIGLAGALLATRVKPDLIAGASVGTLMGGALASMFRSLLDDPDEKLGSHGEVLNSGAFGRELPREARKKLLRLVEVFVKVDKEVALTRRLKRAFRDLGIRGRSINLSPNNIRRMIAKGSRADPGYASTGAPPALVDAISDLFLVPYLDTSEVAAQFVSGHISDAFHRFGRLVKTDGLRRLGVEYAVMGTSLLVRAARDLLVGEDGKIDLARRQPYQVPAKDDPDGLRSIAFLATATDLGSEEAVILGADADDVGKPFNFLDAALASSAFPGVFAPRRASEVFPGTGHPEVRFADGGMFNNLPFLPAFKILADVQRMYREGIEKTGGNDLGDSYTFLERREGQPDLFLVAALDTDPTVDETESFRDLRSIVKRSTALAKNAKIRSFEHSTKLVHRQIRRLLEVADTTADLEAAIPLREAASKKKASREARNASGSAEVEDFINRVDELVAAGVLPVYPTDPEHLNGTFAFCASTGLERKRLLRSIADGCFRTLYALATGKGTPGFESEVLTKSLSGLKKTARVPNIECRRGRYKAFWRYCPYYAIREADSKPSAAKPIMCPFGKSRAGWSKDEEDRQREITADGVYQLCTRDKEHRRLW